MKYNFAMFYLSSSVLGATSAAFVNRGTVAAMSSRHTAAAFLAARTRRSSSRLYSSTSSVEEPNKPVFDAEMSKVYQIVAENHRHPSGPWVTMLDKIHEYSKTSAKNGKFTALDLATGPGEPAETIARQFPDSTVVATDLSPDQVKIANGKAATLPHMTAQVADMQDLCDFDDNSFDVVTCCYGFMFPPDIPRAVKESYRVLKPGGVLVATTWNRVGMMAFLRAVMTDVLGQEPPPPPANPLSLKDPGVFESMLKDAGFDSIQSETHEYPFDMTKDPEMQLKASMMLVREKLTEMDAWDKAKLAFDKHKYDFGAYNDNGHWLLVGNEYKLTACYKPAK